MKICSTFMLAITVAFDCMVLMSPVHAEPLMTRGVAGEMPRVQFNTDAQSVNEEYWTEERMRNTEPLPIPEISEAEFQRLITIPEKSELNNQNGQKEIQFVDGYSKGEPTKADVTKRPFWNAGKIFFTRPDGKGRSCTAQYVGSHRVIMTAAHCLVDSENVWSTNIRFYQGYENGRGQIVGWECMAVWPDWITLSANERYKFDYAFLYADTDSDAGWLGLKTNIPYSTWTAIGYPKEHDNGQYMYRVDGFKGSIENGLVEMKNNPMSSGTSGGAWIGDLTIPYVGGNYAIGLNTSGMADKPTSEFGPYFDSKTFALYEYVSHRCR